jgi:hypothetical protein
MTERANTWTPALINQLIKLWKAKHTATEIANIMQLGSRSMILGKVHRLRIQGRITAEADEARSAKPAKKPTVYVRAFKPRPKPRVGAPAPAPKPTGLQAATLADIGPNRCHWIEADCAASDMGKAFMCGEATGGKVYCQHHHNIAHFVQAPNKLRSFTRWAMYHAR